MLRRRQDSSTIHRGDLSWPRLAKTAHPSGAVGRMESHHAKPTGSSRIAPDRSTDTTLGRGCGYDHTCRTSRLTTSRCSLSCVCSEKETQRRQYIGSQYVSTPRGAVMAGGREAVCIDFGPCGRL